MSISLYANFPDASHAEKALGALVDHGAESSDLTAFFPPGYFSSDNPHLSDVEKATSGITTTTSADAIAGAGKGAGLGLGLGAVAALASLFIPGFGLVTGGGALATALSSLAATAVGGALAGGVAGFLRDQGVPERIALDSENALQNGHALLIISCPTGPLGEFEVREILSKYHASEFGRNDAPAVAKVDLAPSLR